MKNSKIIGFILSKQKIQYLPKLNEDIKILDISLDFGHLSLYYYGDIEECTTKSGKYSMGYPPSENIRDYNVLISVGDDFVEIQNDWLGAIPVFYNKKSLIVSTFPITCLSKNSEIDTDGLKTYLKYGFSAFSSTPFKQIKFLYFSSSLSYTENNIHVTDLPDPVKEIDNYKDVSEENIWAEIKEYIQYRENYSKGKIILPISGGLDSRIISYFIKDPQNVYSYSYGISNKQHDSFEVCLGKEIAKRLNFNWKQLSLGNAYNYYDDWFDLYAYSTHLHGMIHVEMYNNILKEFPNEPLSMISGICGGVFTGASKYKKIHNAKELYQIAFTHGLNYGEVDSYNYEFEQHFIEKYNYMIDDLRLYPIITMRIKLMLLSYLMTVPSVMGIPSWTPFLNFDIVMKMLNLPEDRRKDRKWVREFFQKNNMDLKKSMLFHNTRNTLNYQLHHNHKFAPLSINLNLSLISQTEIEEINKYLTKYNLKVQLKYKLTTTRVVKEIIKKIGINNDFNKNLSQYQCLKCIEYCLKRINSPNLN